MNNKLALDEGLLAVEKPARYTGNEFNSIIKDFEKTFLKFVFCFPDSYEVGMSHLGLKIIYHILNREEDVLCERCFAPWPDMEQMLRQRNTPLFSLENQKGLKEFDVIGFSLQYELCYTNVLNMLELAGIPLYSSQRKGFPLVIAGGPCCYNPEPMRDFIDAFVIGEAEESLLEIIEIVKKFKKNHTDPVACREKLLEELSLVEGIYVPSVYRENQHGDGKKKINKRYIKNFEEAAYPLSPLVPYIAVIHDRISVEIMRGCPNKCFFCQAGFTLNPVRLRSAEKIVQLARQSYQNTGFEAISFCALSTANHPFLKEIILKLAPFCAQKGIALALPSLRVDKNFFGSLKLLEGLKKTGLTFAPEAGSERLRKLVNKNIDLEELKKAVVEAYACGWKRLKLYFMIGFPSETEADLSGIVDLVFEFAGLRKKIDSKMGNISIGISNFIPKPHTPLQWFEMDRREILISKQNFLKSKLGKKFLEVDFHDVRMSFVEACFSRGDAKLHQVLFKAFKKGARFDGWSNMFKFDVWQAAFDETGIDAGEYVYKRKGLEQELSWDYINCGITKEELMKKFLATGIVDAK